MRFLGLLFLLLLSLVLDVSTKTYFDDIVWQEYCYEASEQQARVIPGSTEESHRIIGKCYQDIQTGKNYESLVYKDFYTPLIGEYLGFKLSYNTGIAFSLPIRGVMLKILTILFVLGLSYYYFFLEYKKNNRLLDIGYIFVLSGAFSHAYERIFVGHVVDFISLKYFAIFNFADIFISIGFCLILLSYFLYERK